MTDHDPLPVAGYTSQSDAKIALVNDFKRDEERLLRKLDLMQQLNDAQTMRSYPAAYAGPPCLDVPPPYDYGWLAIARTQFEQAFMALNRAVFQPQRIKLPEDE